MIPEYEDSPVIEFRLGDGIDRRGFLGVGEIKELRRLTGMGPVKLARVLADDPDPEHIAEIVRLSLIGGGADPQEALSLAQYYCQPPRPLEVAWRTAMAMMGAWWKGIPKPSKVKPATTRDDVDIAQWEADAARCGIGIEALHRMSVAEWLELRRKFTEDADKPEAPDAATFRAMKRATPAPEKPRSKAGS